MGILRCLCCLWGLTFVYVFSIANRQRNLTREIEALKRALGSKAEGE